MHGPVSDSPRTARPGMTLAVWCLVLGGLFAMHGLSTHGAGTHGSMRMPPAPGPSEVPTMPGHSEHSAAGTPVAIVDPHDLPGDGSLLALMCLAVLGGLFMAIALALLKHLSRRGFPWTVGEYIRIQPSGRDRDPPLLTRLSVMRC